MGKFNQIDYNNKFNKENYDIIKVVVPKGQKDIISKYAKEKQYKSTSDYIKTLIRNDMENGI